MYVSEIFDTAPADKRSPLEQKVYAALEKQKIAFTRVDNDTVSSMEQCKIVDEKLGDEVRKSIFLCNQKKTSFYLLVMPAQKAFDTADFCSKLNISRVSFANAEHMQQHLGVTPGNATIMGLLNDEDDYVQLILDKEVATAQWFSCNPGANTSHLKFLTTDLIKKFLPFAKHSPTIIEL